MSQRYWIDTLPHSQRYVNENKKFTAWNRFPTSRQDLIGRMIQVMPVKEHCEEVLKLNAELKTAIRLLRIGKQKFAPNTTNSDVDSFLEKYVETETSHT